MPRKFVSQKVAAFSGPMSPAVIAGDTVYFSGMLSLDPVTGELRKGSAADETRQILENLQTMLGELGHGLDRMVMMQCFLTGMEHNDGFGQVYTEYFGSLPCPAARRTIVVPELWGGCKVEISGIAHIGKE